MKESSIVPSLLLVAFIILKLCGVIDWSWWWVISPLWIPIVFALPLVVFIFVRRSKALKTFQNKRKSAWQERLDEMENRKNRYKDGK